MYVLCMCVCMYIYVYVVCVCVYIYIYIYIYVYVYYICICVCVYMYRFGFVNYFMKNVEGFNPLNSNITKWSNKLKQFISKLPKNCLSVFDHFVRLALKGLTKFWLIWLHFAN